MRLLSSVGLEILRSRDWHQGEYQQEDPVEHVFPLQVLEGTTQDEGSKRVVSQPGTEALASNRGGLQKHLIEALGMEIEAHAIPNIPRAYEQS